MEKNAEEEGNPRSFEKRSSLLGAILGQWRRAVLLHNGVGRKRGDLGARYAGTAIHTTRSKAWTSTQRGEDMQTDRRRKKKKGRRAR